MTSFLIFYVLLVLYFLVTPSHDIFDAVSLIDTLNHFFYCFYGTYWEEVFTIGRGGERILLSIQIYRFLFGVIDFPLRKPGERINMEDWACYGQHTYRTGLLGWWPVFFWLRYGNRTGILLFFPSLLVWPFSDIIIDRIQETYPMNIHFDHYYYMRYHGENGKFEKKRIISCMCCHCSLPRLLQPSILCSLPF